jgi:hypothetical protein
MPISASRQLTDADIQLDPVTETKEEREARLSVYHEIKRQLIAQGIPENEIITTLSYALEKIDDIGRAREFHQLALAISGEMADARTQIAVFKTYYDRIRRGEREDRFRSR